MTDLQWQTDNLYQILENQCNCTGWENWIFEVRECLKTPIRTTDVDKLRNLKQDDFIPGILAYPKSDSNFESFGAYGAVLIVIRKNSAFSSISDSIVAVTIRTAYTLASNIFVLNDTSTITTVGSIDLEKPTWISTRNNRFKSAIHEMFEKTKNEYFHDDLLYGALSPMQMFAIRSLETTKIMEEKNSSLLKKLDQKNDQLVVASNDLKIQENHSWWMQIFWMMVTLVWAFMYMNIPDSKC